MMTLLVIGHCHKNYHLILDFHKSIYSLHLIQQRLKSKKESDILCLYDFYISQEETSITLYCTWKAENLSVAVFWDKWDLNKKIYISCYFAARADCYQRTCYFKLLEICNHMRATKIVKGLEYLLYEERLRYLSAQPREEKAQRNLINIYKEIPEGRV